MNIMREMEDTKTYYQKETWDEGRQAEMGNKRYMHIYMRIYI